MELKFSLLILEKGNSWEFLMWIILETIINSSILNPSRVEFNDTYILGIPIVPHWSYLFLLRFY